MTADADIVSLHGRHLASTEKFDYFLLGISAAALAYLGEKFTPEPIAFSQNTIELISIVFLCLAFIFSLLRLEQSVGLIGMNFENLKVSSDQKELVSALHTNERQYDTRTGAAFDPSNGLARLQILKIKEEVIQENFEASGGKVRRYYMLRKWCLLIGFVRL